jgi:hypothetical protein
MTRPARQELRFGAAGKPADGSTVVTFATVAVKPE